MKPTFRALIFITTLALVVAACSDNSGETTTTTIDPALTTTSTTAAPTTTTSSTTTTTTIPGGPALINSGDQNETVATFQWLLNCNGYANVTVDGNYGAGTLSAMEAAQTALGRAANGSPDEETLIELSRTCADPRPIEPTEPMLVVANTDPIDPEVFTLDLSFGSVLDLAFVPAEGLIITVLDANGALVEPTPDTFSWVIPATNGYQIIVASDGDPITFEMTVTVTEAVEAAGWLMRTNSISFGDVKLTLGDGAAATITKIFDALGHGVRGGGEFDTGWDDPGQPGFRGISIEGFRFLFTGPNVDFPGRPETLARIRVLAPTTDADGNPRPLLYVTTPEGLGVGHSLADLKEIYPGATYGKNSKEHYYKLTNNRGVLCFYFGATAPTDSSPIIEMATECRTG